MRLLLGDTDPASPRLTDPEIAYFITKGNGVAIRAAWFAATSLVAKYSQKLTITVGPSTVQYRTLVAQLKELLLDIESQGGKPGSLNVGAPTDASQYQPPVIGGADWSNNRDW